MLSHTSNNGNSVQKPVYASQSEICAHNVRDNEAFAFDFAFCQVGFKIRQEKKRARLDYPGAHLRARLKRQAL